VRILDLDHKRQGPAKLIQRALLHSIPIAVKAGVFSYLGDDTLETKAERLAIQVEKAVLDTHPDSESYIAQCRTIGYNLKSNQELSNSLLVKTITPLALAGMTSDDMATRELKQETAAMKAKADKQSILIAEEGPRIRKTHKGEELVGGDDQIIANDNTMSTSRRRSTFDPSVDIVNRSRENSPGVELPEYGSRSQAIPKHPLNIETKVSLQHISLAQLSTFPDNSDPQAQAPPVRKPSQADFDINKVSFFLFV